jgi:hypothetical protein
MRGPWLILAGFAIAAVNAVGCGGSEHARVNPEAMLDSAAAHPIRSADTEIDLRLQLEGSTRFSGPIRLRLEGPYRSADADRIPSFDWRMSVSALGFPVGGRLVSTGDNVYLSVSGNQYEVGAASVAAANERLARAGALHPRVRRWLGPARVTGDDSAGGEDCERISAPLRGEVVQRDLAPLARELGLDAPSVSGTAVACMGFDDRILHELELDAMLGLSPADSARLGGATAIHLEADVVNNDVGEPQRIETPGGSFRPIRDLFLTLNDLAGSI